MSRAAKVGAIAAAFLTVAAWAWLHGAFNGANLLAIIGLAIAIAALWISLLKTEIPPEEQVGWSWTDSDQHGGDGI